jgi:phosphate transport system regulatory protein PhoU
MFEGVYGMFDWTLGLQIGSKILLALVLGGLIGWERERRKLPAGVRTFILVSVGSCIFTILSSVGFSGSDPARVAAQIVTGIGFLGAGVMIQRKGTVHGLTSAAGIWSVAAVGMAVGTGNYFLAIFGAGSIYVVLGLLRQVFKAQVSTATRRTLNTTLRQVRNRITAMGDLAARAIRDAVEAVNEGDHDLAYQVVEGDAHINRLRYQVEEECLGILRTHRPQDTQLRTVIAATHIATNLERMGDYAKEISLVRLQMGDEPLLASLDKTVSMADKVSDLIQQVLVAFAKDDVETARAMCKQVTSIDEIYEEIVVAVTNKMTEKRTKHFERGSRLLTIAYDLKRAAERVTNIAEQIVFVRTGALAEIDPEDLKDD